MSNPNPHDHNGMPGYDDAAHVLSIFGNLNRPAMDPNLVSHEPGWIVSFFRWVAKRLARR